MTAMVPPAHDNHSASVAGSRASAADPGAQSAPGSSAQVDITLFDYVADSVLLLDAELRCTYVNPAGLRGLQRPAEALLGKRLLEVYPSLANTGIPQALAAARQTRAAVQLTIRPMGVSADVLVQVVPHGAGLMVLSRGVSEGDTAPHLRQQATRRFEALFDANPAAMLLLRAGDRTILDANAAWLRIFGYEHGDVVGQAPATFCAWLDAAGRVGFEAELTANGAAAGLEMQLRQKSGVLRDVTLTAQSVDLAGEACLLAVFADVTERKRVEAERRRNERLLRLIVDAIPVATVVVRQRDLQLLTVNAMWCAQSGYSAAEVVGRTAHDVGFWVEPEEVATFSALLREHGAVERFPARLRTKRGEIRQKLITGRLVELDGEPCMVNVTEDVTERMALEQARRESDALFQALFAHSPDAIVLIDPHDASGTWPIVECNDAACRMNGYTRDEMLGLAVDDLNLNPTDPAERMSYLERVRREGLLKFEDIHRRKDGSLLPVEIATSVVTHGGRELVLGIDRDITERYAAARKAKVQAARLELLAAASRAFAEAGGEPRRALQTTTQLVLDLLGDGCTVHLYGEDRQSLELAALTHPGVADGTTQLAELLGSTVSLAEQPLGPQMTSFATPLVVALAQMALFREQVPPFYRDWLDRSSARNIIVAPIRLEEHTFGFVTLVRFKPELADYDESDAHMAQNLADRAALALANARLLRRVQSELAERKQAEAALRASEERFRLLAEHSQDVILYYRFAAPRGFEYVSPSTVSLCEYLPEEHYADPDIMRKIVHPDDRALLNAVGRGQRRGEPQELRVVTKRGQVRWAELRSVPLMGPKGRPIGVLTTARDITDRKRAEQALRASETRFATMFRNSPAPMTMIRAEGGIIVDVNESFEELLGYARDELIGRSALELTFLSSPEQQQLALERLHRDGSYRNVEMSFTSRSGETRAALVSGVMVEVDGEACILRSYVDISERKAAEAALRASEARSATMFRNSPAAMTMTRLEDGHMLDVNESFEDLLGYRRAELIGQTSVELRLHPDNEQRAQIVAELRARGWFRNREIRFVTKAGVAREVLMSAAIIEVAGEPCIMGSYVDISERKAAEAALRASEERFRATFDQAAVGVAHVALTGRFLRVNQRICAMGGYTEAEMLARGFREILVPDQLDQTAQQLRLLLRKKLPHYSAERCYVRKDGTLLWIQATVSVVYDGDDQPQYFMVVAEDITERRQALAALRAAEERYRLLVENIPAVVYAGTHTATPYVSPQVETILGFTPAEWTSSPDFWYMQIHPDDRERVLANNFGDYGDDKAPPIEYRVLRRDGSVCWMYNDHWLVELGTEGAPAVQGILIDITERTQAEAALRDERASLARRVEERTADLRVAVAELAHAVRLKDEFLANMSHELRTPLNAILGRSQLLLEQVYGPLSGRQSDAVRSIEHSGQHLLALINDVLDLAKIEAGKLVLQRAAVAVEPLCQQSAQLVAQSAQAKDIELTIQVDPQVTDVAADELRLKQILVNLLSNAVKFTPAGGRIALEVSGDRAAGLVRFTVVDTGIGIAAAEQELLFQPFVQLDGGLSRHHEGTGLGLALVRRLAEAHGGRVGVASEVGHGSRFTVELPWQGDPEPNLSVPEPGAPDSREAPLDDPAPGRRVLLAEDNEANIELLLDYLGMHGYSVTVARTGLEAVEHAAATVFDAILMDIHMPGLDGLAAMRRIRAAEDARHVPIVALTALAMPADRERCLEAGADDYVSKPLNLQSLLATLDRLLLAQGPRP